MTPYYDEDGITLYLGDCREVLPNLTGVDAVITDPPYGVGFAYGQHDDQGGDPYAALISEVQGHIERLSAVRLITPGISNLWAWPPADWVMCWHKPGASGRSRLRQSVKRAAGGFNEWEPILIYGQAIGMSDVIRVVKQARDIQGHPCPKPLALVAALVEASTREGATILDPFAGSGTTLVAAKKLGRRAVGIEVDERYCELIVSRLAQGVLNFGDVA